MARKGRIFGLSWLWRYYRYLAYPHQLLLSLGMACKKGLMMILLAVLLAVIVSVLLDRIFSDDVVRRIFVHCAVIIIVSLTIHIIDVRYGKLRSGCELVHAKCYRTLSFTYAGGGNSAVILRDEYGRVYPMECFTPVKFGTNGLCAAIGDKMDNCILIPIN